jgi:hypothetical protein
MEVVFKKTDPSVSDTLLTVNDTEFERFYPRINTNTAWSNWLPYIEQATRRYVFPFISEAWYTVLVDKHHAGTIQSPSEKTALELLQTAVAYYAAMYAYPKEMDLFSDAGNMVNTQMGGSTPTSIGIFKSKLWDLTLTADDHLDTLLAFLEEQVKLNNTAFNAFKTSAAFLRGKADLFRTTEEVQIFHNIGSSRRTYLSLLPYFRDAARLYVMPQIGQDMYNELVEQIGKNTLTPNNAVLLDYVRPALIKYALMCAADADGLSFEFDVPRVVSNPDGMDARQVMVANRLKNRLSQRSVFEQIGKQYLTDLANHLKANLDKYPTFQNQIFNANDTVNASKIVVSHDKHGRVVGGIGMF